MAPFRRRNRPSKVELVIIQTVSADYRQPVWRAMFAHIGDQLLIIAGSSYFSPSTITRHDHTVPMVRVRNWYLIKRRILLQGLPIGKVACAPVVIAELNPRVLTTWLVLGGRKLLRRRTVLWGHAFSTSRRRDWLRQVMRRLADTIVVYSDTEGLELRRRMPQQDIVVAPNALLTRRDMVARPASPRASDFIYVGRLVTEKRPDLLVDAYLRALPDLPATTRLVIIGDGPLRDQLARQVDRSDAGERVRFCGHVADTEALRSLYTTALASVSPGYVGLSLIQSLGFGVPMIIADQEPHKPEIEAADPDMNCTWFRAGSVDALADALVAVTRTADQWRACAPEIARACRDGYSVEVLAARLLESALPPKKRWRSR